MPIVKLENARNLTELARRLHGGDAQDPRIAAAVRALAAANPRLPADLSGLPPGTPIVVPEFEGVPPPRAASAVPQHVNLLELVRFVADASKQIVSAAQSGSEAARDDARATSLQRFIARQPALKLAPTAPKTIDPQMLAAQLRILGEDAEAFLKSHGD